MRPLEPGGAARTRHARSSGSSPRRFTATVRMLPARTRETFTTRYPVAVTGGVRLPGFDSSRHRRGNLHGSRAYTSGKHTHTHIHTGANTVFPQRRWQWPCRVWPGHPWLIPCTGRGRVSFRWLGNTAETVTSSRLIGPGTTTPPARSDIRGSRLYFFHPSLFRWSKKNTHVDLYSVTDAQRCSRLLSDVTTMVHRNQRKRSL